MIQDARYKRQDAGYWKMVIGNWRLVIGDLKLEISDWLGKQKRKVQDSNNEFY